MANTTNPKSSRKTKGFTVDPQDRFAVGIDTHKRSYQVIIWSHSEDREVKAWVQPPTPALLVQKLEPLRGQISVIAYEAGPGGFVLARFLKDGGWPVLVASPGDMLSSRNKAKSDRNDARKTGRLGCKGMLDAIYIPTEREESERQVQRTRNAIMADRKRVQMRIKSLLLFHGFDEPAGLRYWSRQGVEELKKLKCSEDVRFSLDMCIEQYEQLCALLAKCDAKLEEIGKREHNFQRMAILRTLRGVLGPKSALEYVLETGPRERFHNRLEVGMYYGLAPQVSASGETRREGDLNNSGNRHLKTLLIEAAWRWKTHHVEAAELYNRMYRNTGCSQKAITAVARKLGIILWRMDQTASAYRPREVAPKNEHRTENKSQSLAA